MMKKTSAALVFLCMVLGLASCGGGDAPGGAAETSPYVGRYISVAGEMFGMVVTEEIQGITMELKDGGKGTVEVEGSKDSMNWTETDGIISIVVGGETLEATAGEDVLVFEDFMGMGMKLTMAKEGSAAASASYLSEDDQTMIGTWQSYEVADILGDDASGSFDPNGLTMVFGENHRVDITIEGETIPQLAWSNLDNWGSVDEDDYDFTWNLEDGVLSVETQIGDEWLTYRCELS